LLPAAYLSGRDFTGHRSTVFDDEAVFFNGVLV
jgi:hypothetical protein